MENMNGITFGTFSAVINILLALLIFSFFFNLTITKNAAKVEGWSWLLVVIGNFVTLLGMGALDLLLDWNALFIGLLAFSVSGAPMAWGAWKRNQDATERAIKAAKE